MIITTEHKIIGGIALVTIAILVGGALLMSGGKKPITVSPEEVIATKGLHWHPKLTITINGKNQDLPANIGLGAVHKKIHTHDTDAKDGVVHIEAEGVVTKDDTKLGNFFKIWGKEFTSNKIFDKTNNSEKKVKMTVNGKGNKDFENYLMKDGDQIEIRYE